MSKEQGYWQRLKEHPGIGFAFVFTIMGFMAGASNKSLSPEDWWKGGLAGMIGMGLFCWLPVLITNRKSKNTKP